GDVDPPADPQARAAGLVRGDAAGSALARGARGAVRGARLRAGPRGDSVGQTDLDVDLQSLAGRGEVDAPDHVRPDPGAEAHAARDLRRGERVPQGTVDLSESDERIDPPVGGDAVDMRLQHAEALFDLQRPGALIDEPILGESAEEEGAPQRALVVERGIGSAHGRPVEAGGAGEPSELRMQRAQADRPLQIRRRPGEPLDDRGFGAGEDTAIRYSAFGPESNRKSTACPRMVEIPIPGTDGNVLGLSGSRGTPRSWTRSWCRKMAAPTFQLAPRFRPRR